MKTLRMRVTISLEEFDPKSNHPIDTTTIASGSSCRILSDSIRLTFSNNQMKDVLRREGINGAEFILREFVDKSIPWPLTETIDNKHKRVLDELKSRWPHLHFHGSIPANSGGRFHIYQITSDEPLTERAVPHPLDPKLTLTTRYSGTYRKLVDGRWVNCYQGMQYYDGVVEEVIPPVGEKEIAEAFRALGVPFVITQQSLTALPSIDDEVLEEDDE